MDGSQLQPIIVEYDPNAELIEVEYNRENSEDDDKAELVNITLKATMES